MAGDDWGGFSRDELRARWGREEVFTFRSIDSTNEEARRLAEDGVAAGAVVLSAEQTKGKGRAGRSWSSPPDAGVYLSMLFRPGSLDAEGPVSVLAGLGLVWALDRAVSGLDPRIKWPNDLYADGLKFGGILTEAAWSGGAPRYLLAGVGINVRPLGAGISQRIARHATSIDEVTGHTTDFTAVADAVIEGLERYLSADRPVLGTADLEALDRYDGMRDRRGCLHTESDEQPVPGTCVGIAPDGALLFRPDRGALRRVVSGTLIPD